MKYEYEAVSGDQSLFDFIDNELCAVVMVNIPSMSLRFANYKDYFGKDNKIIAERKVKQAKLPVVGDKLIFSGFTSEYRYQVVAINEKSVSVLNLNGINEGHYDSFNISALDKCTIIDQSKQPNPVNMVEEKWFPEKGDRFRYMGNAEVFTVIRVEDLVVVAVADYSSESVRISKLLKFIKA